LQEYFRIAKIFNAEWRESCPLKPGSNLRHQAMGGMTMKRISRRQMLALAFVAMLSPFLRLIPGQAAAVAGRSAWLAALPALAVLLLLAKLLERVLKAAPGGGLAEAGCRILGDKAGKVMLVVWSAWLCFHGGFILRSGADRFIGTIFPDSEPWIFVGVMAALVLVAGLGSVKTLARTAEIFRPLLAVVLAAVLLMALSMVRWEYVLPVTAADVLPGVKGSIIVVDPLCIMLLLAGFLMGYDAGDTPFFRSFARFAGVSCLLAAAICAVVTGVCGATLTAHLTYPFFAVVRDLTIFHTMQRFEALVVGLWVLPDFVLVSMELLIAADNLMLVFGGEKPEHAGLSWRDGNRYVWIGTAVAVVTAVLIARTADGLALWAFTLVPAVNLTMCFAYPVVLFCVGKARKLV